MFEGGQSGISAVPGAGCHTIDTRDSVNLPHSATLLSAHTRTLACKTSVLESIVLLSPAEYIYLIRDIHLVVEGTNEKQNKNADAGLRVGRTSSMLS